MRRGKRQNPVVALAISRFSTSFLRVTPWTWGDREEAGTIVSSRIPAVSPLQGPSLVFDVCRGWLTILSYEPANRWARPAPDMTVLEVVEAFAQPTDPLSPHLCVRVSNSQASFGAK